MLYAWQQKTGHFARFRRLYRTIFMLPLLTQQKIRHMHRPDSLIILYQGSLAGLLLYFHLQRKYHCHKALARPKVKAFDKTLQRLLLFREQKQKQRLALFLEEIGPETEV